MNNFFKALKTNLLSRNNYAQPLNLNKSPINASYFTNLYQNLLSKDSKYFILTLWSVTNSKTLFVPTFYVRSEYIWQDGFLFDFLQKKTADA
tara:strand:- start:1116 stop:1391 length:276 start_codon:yes stop_codon:yes gene_type:complete